MGKIVNILSQDGLIMNEENQADKFEKNGYLFIENFLDSNTLQTISLYFENKVRREEWIASDNKDEISKFSYYADPLIEVILNSSCHFIGSIINKELYPTYSYSRIYQFKDELKKHVDRPSCEISVTVNVANKGKPSSIWMQYKNHDPVFFNLNPGDAILYKGCETEHWREPLLEDQLNVQFMLHYVDKFGKNSKNKYDFREKLGFKSVWENSNAGRII